MLKKHIHNYLKAFSGTEEEKKRFLDFLFQLKDDEDLLQEFIQLDKTEILEDEEQTESLETLIGTDFNLTEETGITEEGETFFGTDFGLSEEETRSLHSEENLTIEIDLQTGGFDDDVDLTDTISNEEPQKLTDDPEKLTLGRYLDLGMLGKGGMGEVRRVRDEVLNRNLAMKIIHSNFLRNKNALTRFIEEAQVGAQLQHPNIVPIHEMGTLPDGRYYFTMKEIKGREFTELIKSVHEASTDAIWKPTKDGTTFRRLIQIFHQICETMAFAHSMLLL